METSNVSRKVLVSGDGNNTGARSAEDTRFGETLASGKTDWRPILFSLVSSNVEDEGVSVLTDL